MATDPRQTYAYRQAREKLRAQHLPCWICRRPIDYALRWPNPMAFTADHYVEVDAGGAAHDEGNLRAAHGSCNFTRGNHYRQGRNTRRASPPEREW